MRAARRASRTASWCCWQTRTARSGTARRSPAGQAALERALALHGRGPYVLQAAIASLHAEEPRDWAEIAALYGELARLTDSPVVELNRAIAIAEEQGPAAGLEIADRIELDDYRYLHSTRGELLRRLGRTDEARDAYVRALELSHDDAERRLLERRIAALSLSSGSVVRAHGAVERERHVRVDRRSLVAARARDQLERSRAGLEAEARDRVVPEVGDGRHARRERRPVPVDEAREHDLLGPDEHEPFARCPARAARPAARRAT